MTTLEDKMAGLPGARRAKIEQRAKALIMEENALRQLRKAHRQTQAKVARRLGIGQDSVSRIERRSDMLISTLRHYVAAIGGNMRLIVEFKDQPAIELNGIGALAKTSDAKRAPSTRKARSSRSKRSKAA
jgi:transcriptional regulator with XRE-family HTH domain